jgi:DNA modification methylase
MPKEPFPRLDGSSPLRKKLLPFCRLKNGQIWEDPQGNHRVGVLDARNPDHLHRLMMSEKTNLIINDPPYNIELGGKNTSGLFQIDSKAYIDFSKDWLKNIVQFMDTAAHLYIWLGADQSRGFQPLPEFMLLMREFEELKSRSFITLRNQRGYGTQKNWMAVRQELLYYTKGSPEFGVQYTDIPKVLKGYYKKVGGSITENSQRSRSPFIRPGNVWIDVQQVFYRMKENVPGAYAQKPLKAIERLIESSSREGDIVTDLFSHSGTTLISAEKRSRRCFTSDIDPIFAELTIRRLEHFRSTGEPGWQWNSPFPEVIPGKKGTGPL